MLRRDVYHCTPSEFKEQDWRDIAMDIHLLEVEAKVKEHKRKAEEKKGSASPRDGIPGRSAPGMGPPI